MLSFDMQHNLDSQRIIVCEETLAVQRLESAEREREKTWLTPAGSASLFAVLHGLMLRGKFLTHCQSKLQCIACGWSS